MQQAEPLAEEPDQIANVILVRMLLGEYMITIDYPIEIPMF